MKVWRWLADAWSRWVRFLSTEEAGLSLAAFRIALGAVLLYDVGQYVGRGLVEFIWLDAKFGGYREMVDANWLVQSLGGASRPVVWTLVVISLTAGTSLLLGWQARVSAFLALQAYMALMSINRHVPSSYYQLIQTALWLLVFANSTATMSLSCRLRTGRWTSDLLVPAWPRYLCVFQLVVMYTIAGLTKTGSDWPLGGGTSALYYALSVTAWHRNFDFSWAAHAYPITQVATVITWAFEILAPFWLFCMWLRLDPSRPGIARVLRRWRVAEVFAVTGVVLHLGILIAMDVGSFSLIALALYLCLPTPAGLKGLVLSARRWRGSKRATAVQLSG